MRKKIFKMTAHTVCLIRPREEIFDYGNEIPPLNLAYLAGALKAAEIKVEILDQPTIRMTPRQLSDHLISAQPSMVGMSLFTPEFESAKKDLKLIRKTLPDALIVVGGPHASALPEQTLKELPEVDVIVIGEGEQTIVELAQKDDFRVVSGIAYLAEGNFVKTLQRPLLENLDELPRPAYDLLPMDKYVYAQRGWEGRRFTTMFSSRGCPFQCTFCAHAVFGRKMRLRSIKNVVDEIEHLVREWGVTAIAFTDDLFTLNEKRMFEFYHEIAERELLDKFIWSCNARVDNITTEMTDVMSLAGCRKVSLGVESGSPEVLKRIKKNITVEQVRKAFKLFHDAGIETLGFFMIGLPGETVEDYKMSVRLAKDINPDFISVTALTPLPGSEVYDTNKHLLPNEWTKYRFTAFNEAPITALGDIPAEKLPAYLKKFYKSFYWRPKYVWSRLKKAKKPSDILFYAKKALKVSKYWLSKK
jgi:anaerobic magnesium-protoporphyrin IX monomethyl ester cyclase